LRRRGWNPSVQSTTSRFHGSDLAFKCPAPVHIANIELNEKHGVCVFSVNSSVWRSAPFPCWPPPPRRPSNLDLAFKLITWSSCGCAASCRMLNGEDLSNDSFGSRLDLRNGQRDRGEVALNKIARMDPARRAELFTETANRLDIPESLIEKGFCVCWVLKQLFSIEPFSGRLLFKIKNLTLSERSQLHQTARLVPSRFADAGLRR
jgi:hypothetical protein